VFLFEFSFTMKRIFLFTLLLVMSTVAVKGYVFECLDSCECDTEEELVDCHDNAQRTKLQLPEKPLRDITVIRLTYNNISTLPSEETLLSKFPRLRAIDVARNPNFDCASQDLYTEVQVMSDCGKNLSELLSNETIPARNVPTEDCDAACQRDRHLDAIRKYLERLWKLIKKKVQEFSKKQKWVDDVQNFVNEWSKKTQDFLNESLRDDEHVVESEIQYTTPEYHPKQLKYTEPITNDGV